VLPCDEDSDLTWGGARDAKMPHSLNGRHMRTIDRIPNATAAVSIQHLIVSAGNVTFQSSSSTKTLGIDATGGNNSVFAMGSGTVTNLGGSTDNPMTLYVPTALIVSTGGSFVSHSASSISDPGVLQVGQIVNGVLAPGTSSFTLQGASTMSLGGDLTIANQSVAGCCRRSNNQRQRIVSDAVSEFRHHVGCVGNGSSSITISNAGLLETGTGLLDIRDTGTVNPKDNSMSICEPGCLCAHLALIP